MDSARVEGQRRDGSETSSSEWKLAAGTAGTAGTAGADTVNDACTVSIVAFKCILGNYPTTLTDTRSRGKFHGRSPNPSRWT